MQINWFTVIAQVINFIILVWLLKKYLYKPILKAIDEREKRISSQLEDAEQKKAAAGKEQEDLKQKNAAFDQERAELMIKAVSETKDERQKLLDEARNDAKALKSKLENALNDKQVELNFNIAKKTHQQVFSIARKTLLDLASVSLEDQSLNIFMKRLTEMKDEEKKKFIEVFKTASKLILVQSAFELSESQQTEIKNVVNEILQSKAEFQFKITPELISGIELTTNGFKLAWSISEYLHSLEKSINETMQEKY